MLLFGISLEDRSYALIVRVRAGAHLLRRRLPDGRMTKKQKTASKKLETRRAAAGLAVYFADGF
jgi:hypothetical protein